MFERLQRLAESQDENARKARDKRLDNLRRSVKTPLLAGYGKLFYILTIIGSAGVFAAETASWLKYDLYGVHTYLRNASLSVFLFWLAAGVTTSLLSLARFLQLKKNGLPPAEEPPGSDKAAAGPEDRSGGPFKRTPETLDLYPRRCRVCLIGAAVLLVFCLIMWL